MLKHFRNLPRAVRLVLWGGVITLVLAFVGLYATARDAKHAEKGETAQTQIVQDTTRSPGEQSTRFRVPAERVPTTVADAEKAAPITLTPGRWQQDPEHANGQDVPNLLPPADRAKVAELVDRFITRWETFPDFKTMTDFLAYQRKLRPLVTSDALAGVIRRADNVQPAYICPEPRCVAGSETVIYDGYAGPGENMEIRSYDSQQQSAYVVTYGIVRYTGDDHPLAHRSFDRSYGLVVRNVNGQWLIARAAADTTGPSS